MGFNSGFKGLIVYQVGTNKGVTVDVLKHSQGMICEKYNKELANGHIRNSHSVVM